MVSTPLTSRALLGAYLALCAGLVVAHLTLTGETGLWASWHLLVWLAVAALMLGPRLYRPRVRRPWRLLTLGLAVMGVSGLLSSGWLPLSTDAVRQEVSTLLMAVGYPLVGLGAARFARAQSGGRDHGPALDSAVVTIALSAVLFEAVFALHGAAGADPHLLAGMLVASASASWVAAMTTRLLLAGGHRFASGWFIGAAAVAGMIGAVGFVLAGADSGAVAGRAHLGWLLALPLLGASALHPSMAELTEPQENVETAHVWARTLLSGTALMAPPIAILVRHVTTGQTAIVSAVASVVIAVIVSVRFGDLVRQRERARQRSVHLSLHDPLTGLANRTQLEDRLRHALVRRRDVSSTVGLLFIDLDGFKLVNDTLGHAAGDELLRATAERLVGAVRPSDTVARFAGDEFVIVMQDVDQDTAEALGERVRASVRRPVAVQAGVGVVTASVGVALARPDEHDPDTLLLRADAAMYEVKRQGRDRMTRTVPC